MRRGANFGRGGWRGAKSPAPASAQLELEGIERPAGHGERGMAFQRMLDRAHRTYRLAGAAVVERNERVWNYTTERRARGLPGFMAAKTLDGARYLMMETSQVDYAGTARGRSVRFDAKETARASIPLDQFTRAQVEELCDHERTGALSGFLVHFSRTGQVFWVAASRVRTAQDRVLFQVGRGTHPKSLSPEWLAEHGLHVYRVAHAADSCDYLPALLAATAARPGSTSTLRTPNP
jgi:recombination protein U